MRTTTVRAAHGAGLLVLLHVALGIGALPATSVTIDEFMHLPAGALAAAARAPVIDLQNAPLWRAALFGVPALLQHARIRPPPTDTGWAGAYRFFLDNDQRYLDLFWAPRLLVLAASALLCVLIWVEARRRFGEAGALLSVALAALCPNLLAHGRLATLDLGVTLATFGVVALFARLRRSPSWRGAALLGFALGLAQTVKFSAALLYPLLALLALVDLPGDEPRRLRLLRLGAAFAVSIAGIDAGYFCDRIFQPLALLAPHSAPFRAAVAAAPWLRAPLPLAYLQGLDLQLVDQAGYTYFLRGELSTRGWPSYFLIAALVKLTIPALVLCAAGLVRAAKDRESLLHLAVPAAAVFALFSLSGHKNIGFRYVLPALPFLYVLAGGLLRANAGALARPAALALALGHAVSSLAVHPHSLAYFNELAGGPAGGLRWLSDSNLDWGQDLPGLRRWMDEHGVPEVSLAYFGRVDPRLYGIRYRLLEGPPARGVMVVSASLLQGIPYFVLAEDRVVEVRGERFLRPDALRWAGTNQYAWLRGRTPEAVIGGSLYVYRSSEEADAASPGKDPPR